MLDELPVHIKLIAVHMDATDHGQTTRAILRNEALHHGVDMSRLLIPEDGGNHQIINLIKKITEMKAIKNVAAAKNFNAISVGKLSELSDYVIELSPEVKIPGKVFGGAALQATGSEFSFQMFQPGTETGFLHTHKNHEALFLPCGKG